MATTVRDVPAHVGGKQYTAISGETIDAVNPATGELIGRFPKFAEADVDAAVAAAKAAFPAWRDMPVLERAHRVDQLANLILEHAEELGQLDVADTGSPIREMRGDAYNAAYAIKYHVGLALEVRGETVPPTDNGRVNLTLRQPFGVVGRIVPFNHPLFDAAAKVAAPLITGNTVVVKPSEHTSLSTLRLAELVADAEILPPGVLNVITGYGAEAGDALVVHPDVRRIAAICSAELGRTIMARAQTHVLKTVTLELGGKNPLVILPDADIELALEGAQRGMNFTWQGQSCMSTSRLLVHQSIYGEFVERLGERIGSLRAGPPADESTETGSIVHRAQYEKVLSYIQIGHDDGARLVTGGGPYEDPALADGMFVRPTLFADVAPDSRLAREEIFGPVLAAMPFSDYDEALRLANGLSLGLTASVYTRDLTLAHRFARDVEAGYVWVNDTGTFTPGAPFGGIKDSGIGREGTIEELLSNTQIKNVNIRFDA